MWSLSTIISRIYNIFVLPETGLQNTDISHRHKCAPLNKYHVEATQETQIEKQIRNSLQVYSYHVYMANSVQFVHSTVIIVVAVTKFASKQRDMNQAELSRYLVQWLQSHHLYDSARQKSFRFLRAPRRSTLSCGRKKI